MTKRRLSKQQSHRIEHRHQQINKTANQGLVIARYSRHVHLRDKDGRDIHCAIRPNINSIVAGDRVSWQPEGPSQGTILSLFPRQSVLGRPNAQGEIKAIAANITQIMVVVAPVPAISWALLDSYLIMADYLNIPLSIVLNKTDIETGDIRKDLLQIYEPLGYPILFTSIQSEDEIKSLSKSLRNQTTVFVGQSGVGKSSIISRLVPEITKTIATGALTQSQLGAHTTSNSHWYDLSSGGALIDSPGVRELSLWYMSQQQIAQGYREFKNYAMQCKFRNCTHHNTPSCAVLSAVKNNQISLKRYENYVKMISEALCLNDTRLTRK